MNRYKFSTKELILIALMAAMGLAVKPLVKTFTHLLSTPLGIPGGTISGGFYMMWLSLALAIVPRFGVASLAGFLQGLVVFVTGWYGSHGAISLLTYSLPGIVIDLLALAYRRRNTLDGQMIYCTAANLAGTWIVGWIIMKLPKVPLQIALSMAVLSGVAGGALSYLIFKELKKYRVV